MSARKNTHPIITANIKYIWLIGVYSFDKTFLEDMYFCQGFKSLTGKDFDPDRAKSYLVSKEKYFEVALSEKILKEMESVCLFEEPIDNTLVISQDYIDTLTTPAESTFVSPKIKIDELTCDNSSTYKNEVNSKNIVSTTTSQDGYLARKENQISDLQKFLELSDEQISQIKKQCEEYGIDEYQFYKKMGSDIYNKFNERHTKTLNGRSLDYYKKEYEMNHTLLYGGKLPIEKNIEDFCVSQDMGGSVVKGATIVTISTIATAGMGIGTTFLSGLSKQMVAGVSTAGATFTTDMISKATNGIDNDKDMSKDALIKSVKSSLINGTFAYFTAGAFKKRFESNVGKVIDSAKFNKHLFDGATTKALTASALDGVVEFGKQFSKGESINTNKILAKSAAAMLSTLFYSRLNVGNQVGSFMTKLEKRATSDAMASWLKNNKKAVIEELKDMGEFDVATLLANNPQVFDNYVAQIVNMSDTSDFT